MDRANLATRAANRNASATRMETMRAMLPNLGQLSLTRTGGTLVRGQSPEDVNCVICFHSLAAPPPDGENVWPFDNDPVIWIVACNNQHAFHKGCLRAYARDSERPNRCPECRVPMLPQVLTHVSRPSSGEHAAREEKEAEARAEGQRRDAAREELREREMLEREQEAFNRMDPEEQRMLERAYEGEDSDVEWDSEREEQAELDARDEEDSLREERRRNPSPRMRDDYEYEDEDSDSDQEEQAEMVPRRSNLETEQDSWSARRDLEWLVTMASVLQRVEAGLQSIRRVEAAVLTCIARGNTAMFGTPAYRDDMIGRLVQPGANQLRTLIVSTSRHTAIKGQLLRLLAAYAYDARVQVTLRNHNAQQRGRASWDNEGAFEEAVRRYVAHLESYPRAAPSLPGTVDEFERDSKDSRLIDALRVLHHLKWDPPVRDEWLLPYNGRDLDLEKHGILDAGSGDRLIIPDTQDRVEFLLDVLGVETTPEAVSAATEPDVYGEVLESLGAVLANFKVWHELYSGFDEYEALSDDDATIPFPFGQEVVQLWGLANYMHGVPEGLEFVSRNPMQEPERAQRYELMRERLTRLVWLGVTWWIGRPYPANNDSATPDEMQHFFWAYVAPEYKTEDRTDDVIFKYEDVVEDLEMVTNHNGLMRDQWVGDRRTGPWFRNLGEFRPTTPSGTPPRAREGGETPGARRQRRE